MKKLITRAVSLTLAIFLCGLFITSCGVSNENIGNLNEQSNISTNTTIQESSEAPTRKIAPEGSYENDKDAPNPNDYQIVFKDKYGDRFYLNHLDSQIGYKRYRGVWYCYVRKQQYIVDLTYNTADSSLCLVAYYRPDKWVMYYHLSKKSDTYFYGSYNWMWKSYSSYYIKTMRIDIEKGSF